MSCDSTESGSRRLLVLCQLFYPELISTGQTLTELCEQLVRSGIDVQVVCGPPTVMDRASRVPRDLTWRGIRIHRVPGTRLPKLNLAGRVLNQVTFALSVLAWLVIHRPRQPILVLTNPPFLALACALLRAARWIGPYHYLVFDVYPDTAVRLGLLRSGGWLARLWEWTNTLAFRYSQTIVVIGRCMAGVIRDKLHRAGLGHLAGRIRRIHIWTDDERIAAAADPAAGPNPYLDRWQLRGKFVVGYFGNMGRFHDIETILEAARRLREYTDILFLFVGEGHQKQYARDYVSRWNLSNCHFETYVPRADLPWSLTVSQVGLVSLQAGQEGLSVPSKAIALMAAARPILAIMSPRGEIAQLVSEHRCGRVIQPGDDQKLAATILQLYHERPRAEALGRNGLQAARSQLTLAAAARLVRQIIFSQYPAEISA